jgi:peptidoglycan/xylan/chitin deacetylase (PgdA/CDA1 family)
MALVTVAMVALSGCVKTTEAAQLSDHVTLPTLQPMLSQLVAGQPAWRNVNRTALAGRLGWGQVASGNKTGRRIALTFDAGAEGAATPAVLDALKNAGLHCTFFVTGQFAKSYPDLVKRMVADGHELGNHSYSHPHFPTLTEEQVAFEISKTEAAVRDLCGLSTKPYFRFPYGSGSNALVEQINALGYLGVLWTLDTLDSMGASAEAILSRVNKGAGPGAIVLMHCGLPETAKILPRVIEDLESQGYQIVSLTEIF